MLTARRGLLMIGGVWFHPALQPVQDVLRDYWCSCRMELHCAERSSGGERLKPGHNQRILTIRAAASLAEGKLVTIFFGMHKIVCQGLSVNQTPRTYLLMGTDESRDDVLVDAAELLAISIGEASWR